MPSLDDLFIKFNSDKSSKHHFYSRIYEKHFFEIKNLPMKILELGIWKGASLQAWEEYFPNSEIYGIDNDTSISDSIDSDRIFRHCISITDNNNLKKFAETHGPFDIIIDDCSHINAHTINAFNILFPFLSFSGLYVIEDLHACYWDGRHRDNVWANQTKPSFIDAIKELVDHCVGKGKLGNAAAWLDTDNLEETGGAYPTYGEIDWYDKNIESMHIYKSMCFIKRIFGEIKNESLSGPAL